MSNNLMIRLACGAGRLGNRVFPADAENPASCDPLALRLETCTRPENSIKPSGFPSPAPLVRSPTHSSNPANGSALELLTAWVWGVLPLALIKYFSGPRNSYLHSLSPNPAPLIPISTPR